jgi:hypothetical protein
MPVSLEAVVAIDTHVHIEDDGHGYHSLDDELMAASAAYFKAGANRAPSLPETRPSPWPPTRPTSSSTCPAPDWWLADLAALEIKPDVRPLILKENAARVLGLAGG